MFQNRNNCLFENGIIFLKALCLFHTNPCKKKFAVDFISELFQMIFHDRHISAGFFCKTFSPLFCHLSNSLPSQLLMNLLGNIYLE